MIKSKTILEVNVGERVYELSLHPESPIGEVFDALCKMQSYVIDRIKQSQPPENTPVEEIPKSEA